MVNINSARAASAREQGDIVTAAYMTPMDVTLGYAIEVAPGHQFFFQGEFVGK